jgi:hypothetical protein
MSVLTTTPTGLLSFDGRSDLFYCHRGADKANTVTREWGKVFTSANANYTQYLSVPARAADTRGGTKPIDGSTTTVVLTGVPANAVGVIGTVTITDTTSPGSYLSIYNGDVATIASPGFSHVNAGLNQTVATTFTSALGASHSLKIYAFKSAHVIIDVAAWVVTGAV